MQANFAAAALLSVAASDLVGSQFAWLTGKTVPQYDEREWQAFLHSGVLVNARNFECQDGIVIGIKYVLKTVSPGLHLLTFLRIQPNGFPSDQLRQSTSADWALDAVSRIADAPPLN